MLKRLHKVAYIALHKMIPQEKLDNMIVNNKKEYADWHGNAEAEYAFNDKPQHNAIIYIRKENGNVEFFSTFQAVEPEDFYRAVWDIIKKYEKREGK